MKSRLKTLAAAAAASVAFSIITLSGSISSGGGNKSILAKATDSHEGYHYAQNLASPSSTGNAEYYACCAHHEIWLASDSTRPSGDFKDRDISSAEGGVSDKAKLYYVALDQNEGSGGTEYIANAFSGSLLPAITIPSKVYSSFEGYYTAKDGGDQYIGTDGVGVRNWDLANNTTLYAHWSHAHVYDYVDEVPATIISTGVAGHYECKSCGKLFTKDGDNYVETTSDKLVLAKLYAEWAGNIDFDTYCTGGEIDNVTASVEDGKLKLTETGTSHYGEYRSLIHYSIKKSHTMRYYISINDVVCSDDCSFNKDGGYPVTINLVVINNGVRKDVTENYYYPDKNFTKLDLTDYVNVNDTNDVQVIIKVVYGTDGTNKNGAWITIGSIGLIAKDVAQTFENKTYDIPAMIADTKVEHVNYGISDGKLVISTYTDNYGTVLPIGVWTAKSIENSYIKFTIDSISDGGSMFLTLDYFDGGDRMYTSCGANAAGTYIIPLASNQLASYTGEHFFKFAFGLQGGNSLSMVISSIELIELGDTWDGDLDLARFAKLGTEERVNASVVNNKLRLTKYGDYHYGDFRSWSKVSVNKESGKKYYMTLSDIAWGSADYTYKTIAVAYYLNDEGGTDVTKSVNYQYVGTWTFGDFTSFTADFTDKLADGTNTIRFVFQMQWGKDGEKISSAYVDIGKITLSVQ
jgi:hypothetical protein